MCPSQEEQQEEKCQVAAHVPQAAARDDKDPLCSEEETRCSVCVAQIASRNYRAVFVHLYELSIRAKGLGRRTCDFNTAGMKSVRTAMTLSKAGNKYQDEDIEARLFMHLVRGEVDEGFIPVKQRLEKLLVELLRTSLRGRYPLKPEAEITVMTMEKCSSTISLKECEDILREIYSPEDVSPSVSKTFISHSD